MTARSTIDGRRSSRRTKFRFLALAAAAVTLTSSLSACGSSSGSGGGGGTFTLSMHIANLKKDDLTTYSIVQAFQKKYPDIKLKVVGQPVDQHEQQMTIAAQTHTLPD